MKRKLMPYLLATTIALIALLISQVIWINLSRHQKQEDRENQFTESFNKAFSNAAFSDVANSTTPSIEIEPLDSVPEDVKRKATNITDLGNINNYDEAAKMVENAFFLIRLKEGKISLVSLDSLIRNRSMDMGKVSSSRLTLYDADDIAIDSLSNSYTLSGRVFNLMYPKSPCFLQTFPT